MAKSVLVTGANSGIGLATVLELAKHGYDVIGTARTEEKAELIAGRGREAGVVIRTVLCDVADAEQCERAFLEVAAMTDGGPWGLVNNAGFAQSGTVEDVDDEAARHQLEVNLLAPARFARLALPTMRARRDGRIVNVSSIAGRVSLPMLGWYCASKHGLEALSDALRAEVTPFGVRVVLVEPGSFASNIWDSGHTQSRQRTDVYADAYRRAETAAAHAGKLPDAVWVARAIRLALGNPVPLARYLVGIDAMVGTALESLAPTALADFVKGASVGLRKLPFRK